MTEPLDLDALEAAVAKQRRLPGQPRAGSTFPATATLTLSCDAAEQLIALARRTQDAESEVENLQITVEEDAIYLRQREAERDAALARCVELEAVLRQVTEELASWEETCDTGTRPREVGDLIARARLLARPADTGDATP